MAAILKKGHLEQDISFFNKRKYFITKKGRKYTKEDKEIVISFQTLKKDSSKKGPQSYAKILESIEETLALILESLFIK